MKQINYKSDQSFKTFLFQSAPGWSPQAAEPTRKKYYEKLETVYQATHVELEELKPKMRGIPVDISAKNGWLYGALGKIFAGKNIGNLTNKDKHGVAGEFSEETKKQIFKALNVLTKAGINVNNVSKKAKTVELNDQGLLVVKDSGGNELTKYPQQLSAQKEGTPNQKPEISNLPAKVQQGETFSADADQDGGKWEIKKKGEKDFEPLNDKSGKQITGKKLEAEATNAGTYEIRYVVPGKPESEAKTMLVEVKEQVTQSINLRKQNVTQSSAEIILDKKIVSKNQGQYTVLVTPEGKSGTSMTKSGKNFVLNSLDPKTKYTVKIQVDGKDITGGTIAFETLAKKGINITSGNTTLKEGATFVATADKDGGKWQQKQNGNWVDIQGETTKTLTLPNLAAGSHEVRYTSTENNTDTHSNVLTVTVEVVPTTTVTPTAGNITQNSAEISITEDIEGVTDYEIIVYEKNSDGAWVELADKKKTPANTEKKVTLDGLDAGKSYKAEIQIDGEKAGEVSFETEKAVTEKVTFSKSEIKANSAEFSIKETITGVENYDVIISEKSGETWKKIDDKCGTFPIANKDIFISALTAEKNYKVDIAINQKIALTHEFETPKRGVPTISTTTPGPLTQGDEFKATATVESDLDASGEGEWRMEDENGMIAILGEEKELSTTEIPTGKWEIYYNVMVNKDSGQEDFYSQSITIEVKEKVVESITLEELNVGKNSAEFFFPEMITGVDEYTVIVKSEDGDVQKFKQSRDENSITIEKLAAGQTHSVEVKITVNGTEKTIGTEAFDTIEANRPEISSDKYETPVNQPVAYTSDVPGIWYVQALDGEKYAATETEQSSFTFDTETAGFYNILCVTGSGEDAKKSNDLGLKVTEYDPSKFSAEFAEFVKKFEESVENKLPDKITEIGENEIKFLNYNRGDGLDLNLNNLTKISGDTELNINANHSIFANKLKNLKNINLEKCYSLEATGLETGISTQQKGLSGVYLKFIFGGAVIDQTSIANERGTPPTGQAYFYEQGKIVLKNENNTPLEHEPIIEKLNIPRKTINETGTFTATADIPDGKTIKNIQWKVNGADIADATTSELSIPQPKAGEYTIAMTYEDEAGNKYETGSYQIIIESINWDRKNLKETTFTNFDETKHGTHLNKVVADKNKRAEFEKFRDKHTDRVVDAGHLKAFADGKTCENYLSELAGSGEVFYNGQQAKKDDVFSAVIDVKNADLVDDSYDEVKEKSQEIYDAVYRLAVALGKPKEAEKVWSAIEDAIDDSGTDEAFSLDEIWKEIGDEFDDFENKNPTAPQIVKLVELSEALQVAATGQDTKNSAEKSGETANEFTAFDKLSAEFTKIVANRQPSTLTEEETWNNEIFRSIDLGTAKPTEIKYLSLIPNLKLSTKSKTIPKELTNLTYLYTRSATSIPKEFTNLTHLSANSATSIPKELTNLTYLYANSATSIPKELTNLTYLSANSATSIPKEFTNLTHLYAHSATVKLGDFPDLRRIYSKSKSEWQDVPTDRENWLYKNGELVEKTSAEN